MASQEIPRVVSLWSGVLGEGPLPEREPDACETGAAEPLRGGLQKRQCIQEGIVARLCGHALAAGPAQREWLFPLNTLGLPCQGTYGTSVGAGYRPVCQKHHESAG